MEEIRELTSIIDKHVQVDGEFITAIPRLKLHRHSIIENKLFTLCKPTICMVVQGRKRSIYGNEIREYGAGNLMTVSVEVPVAAEILEAAPDRPLLCLQLELDPALLGTLFMESGIGQTNHPVPASPVLNNMAEPAVLDAMIRLLRLLDEPDAIFLLAPLVEKEILYRLMKGEQIGHLRRIAFADARLQQVNKAINLIKQNYRQGLSIDDLAGEACMSPSALHHHFKAITGLSPLQYQKQLRLQEARRLMLSQTTDAATVGHLVGYDSPSQFSREYRRLFGAPPVRHIARLKSPSVPANVELLHDMPKYGT